MCVIYEVTEHNDSITAICFASCLVAHVVVGAKRVVNTKQIQVDLTEKELENEKLNAFRQFDLDGTILAPRTTKMVTVVIQDNGEEEEEEVHESVSSNAKSSAVLYTASDDGELYTWLLSPGGRKPILRHKMKAHKSGVSIIIFYGANTGGTLLSSDQSGLTVIWADVLSGALLFIYYFVI